MIRLDTLRRLLRPEEILFGALTLVLLIVMSVSGHWIAPRFGPKYFIVAAVLLGYGIGARAYLARRRRSDPPRVALAAARRAAFTTLRDFLPFAAGLVVFELLHDLTPILSPEVVDGTLVAIDRALFGVDVAVWMTRFARPWLTHVLLACYSSYFFTPAVVAVYFYLRGRRGAFRELILSLSLVTVVGFVGYLAVPAVGPYLFQAELFPARMPPGGRLAAAAMSLVDRIRGVSRDCFPSLHTAHAVAILALLGKHARWLAVVYAPVALGIVLSTMYLRVHYAIDVIAGVVVAAVCVAVAPRLEGWWRRPSDGGLSGATRTPCCRR